jgi:hypothetical protein
VAVWRGRVQAPDSWGGEDFLRLLPGFGFLKGGRVLVFLVLLEAPAASGGAGEPVCVVFGLGACEAEGGADVGPGGAVVAGPGDEAEAGEVGVECGVVAGCGHGPILPRGFPPPATRV